jgi:hypothetical protein
VCGSGSEVESREGDNRPHPLTEAEPAGVTSGRVRYYQPLGGRIAEAMRTASKRGPGSLRTASEDSGLHRSLIVMRQPSASTPPPWSCTDFLRLSMSASPSPVVRPFFALPGNGLVLAPAGDAEGPGEDIVERALNVGVSWSRPHCRRMSSSTRTATVRTVRRADVSADGSNGKRARLRHRWSEEKMEVVQPSHPTHTKSTTEN